jgi:hypothetical protein
MEGGKSNAMRIFRYRFNHKKGCDPVCFSYGGDFVLLVNWVTMPNYRLYPQ